MSSLRPATIVAALFHLIGGSLAEAAEPTGPACTCEACQQAWRRNQSPDAVPARNTAATGKRRVTGG